MFSKPLSFVEAITTGPDVQKDKIIKINILQVKNEPTLVYSKYLNPKHIDRNLKKILAINNLDQNPTFDKVSKEIYQILNNSTIVTFKPRFIYGIIKNEFKRLGINFNTKNISIEKALSIIYQQQHDIDYWVREFDINSVNKGDFGKLEILWRLYTRIEGQIDSFKFKRKVHSSKPINIIDQKELPNHPGVYIFYGKNNTVLYVGKSINIKERVNSHFNNDINSSKEMHIIKQVDHIESIITAGELGALIKEYELIEKLKPIYNTKAKRLKEVFAIELIENINDYHILKIRKMDKVKYRDLKVIVSLHKSKAKAKAFLEKLSEEFNLCKTLLGLEKGTCFNYALGKCKGACKGIEKIENYNKRLKESIETRKIEKWPFKGAIQIKETYGNLEEIFTFKNWCLINNINDRDYYFDKYIYFLLKEYISKDKYKENISIL